MAVSPDGIIALTTSETTNMARRIDTETHALFAKLLVGSGPRHAEFVKDGTELWVSSEIGGTITVFDVASAAEIGKIDLDPPNLHPNRVQPVGFEFIEGETHAVVALDPSNHIAFADADTP